VATPKLAFVEVAQIWDGHIRDREIEGTSRLDLTVAVASGDIDRFQVAICRAGVTSG
jgi:hypothetical protein